MGFSLAALLQGPWSPWLFCSTLLGAFVIWRIRCALSTDDAPLNDESEHFLNGHRIEHRLVGSWPAELLWAEPSEGKPEDGAKGRPLVVLIPGFPGVGGVYRDFLRRLAQLSSCRAVCIAWSGHHHVPEELARKASSATSSLEEQAAFFAAVLQELRASAGVSSLVLIGQSLGCWFALRALEVLDGCPGPPVAAVHLMSPVFQEMAAIPRGKKVAAAVRTVARLRLDLVPQLLTGTLPTSCVATLLQRIWWLRGKASLEEEEQWLWLCLVAHVQLGVISKAVHVAVEAMDQIQRPGKLLDALHRRGDRVFLHFAIGDGWTPPEVQLHLSGLLPSAQVRHHQMPHGIVTQRQQALLAAEALGREIAEQIR